MPVIINSQEIHPFLPSLGSPLAIDRSRAERQDIRPLEIAHHQSDGGQDLDRAAARALARQHDAAGQPELRRDRLATCAASPPGGAAAQHAGRPHPQVLQPLQPTSATRSSTASSSPGVNALKDRVEQEDFLAGGRRHPAMDDDATRSPALFLCWGAKAALKYLPRHRQPEGRDRSCSACSSTGWSRTRPGCCSAFPDLFPVPVSRWKSPKREDILKVPALEIVADSEEAGPNMLVESEPLDNHGRALPAAGLHSQPSRIRDGDARRGVSPRQRRSTRPSPCHALFSGGRSVARRAQPLAPHRAYLHELGQGGLRGDALQHRRLSPIRPKRRERRSRRAARRSRGS